MLESNLDSLTTEEVGTDEVTVETKTYTSEEVQALLQSESDKRVTSALKKQEERFAKKQQESEKLRTMDTAQRKEYELNERIKELESKEKDYTIMSNKIECGKILSDRGLDSAFIDYVVSESAEEMMINIDTFDRVFKSAVSDAVGKKIAGKTPLASNTNQKTLDREGFKKLTIGEQAELYKTNPSLYKQLSSL